MTLRTGCRRLTPNDSCDKKSVVPKSLEEEVNQGSGGAGRAGGEKTGGVDIDRGQGGSASRGGAELGERGQRPPSGLELWSALLPLA